MKKDKNNKLQIAKNLDLDQKDFTNYIASYFLGKVAKLRTTILKLIISSRI